LREGWGRETASLYQDIVKPRQTPVMAHISRGVQYDEIGQHELAIDEFLAAKELEPNNVDGPPRGRIRVLGRFVEADRAMDKALFFDPVSVQARVGEAILAFRKGLYSAAEEQLKGLCERN
jgi:tetratricopeptide (TPR) repeat protein